MVQASFKRLSFLLRCLTTTPELSPEIPPQGPFVRRQGSPLLKNAFVSFQVVEAVRSRVRPFVWGMPYPTKELHHAPDRDGGQEDVRASWVAVHELLELLSDRRRRFLRWRRWADDADGEEGEGEEEEGDAGHA